MSEPERSIPKKTTIQISETNHAVLRRMMKSLGAKDFNDAVGILIKTKLSTSQNQRVSVDIR